MYSMNTKSGLLFPPTSSSIFKVYNKERRDTPIFTDIEGQSQNDANLKEIVKKNFQEYCDESSIHGFKYIGQRKRMEKFLWILICVFLLGGCGTQIYEIVGKWRRNPLIFLLDTKISSIHEVR